MKKASKAFFSVVIMLTLAVFSATAANAASNKDRVFEYLTEKIGFNSAAACGIMANIEHESNFDPTEVIIDSNGLLSGGLCQWNGSRFSNLKNFCRKNGYHHLSINGQLEYLKYELTKNQYKHIYNYLKSVPNTKDGAYNAAYYWCYYFEFPASRSSKSVRRGISAKSAYWNTYGKENLYAISMDKTNNKKTFDIADTINVNWSSAGKSTEKYVLCLAKYVNGKFDYDNAKEIVLGASNTSYKLKLGSLKLGKYKAYVKASSSWQEVKSDSFSFSVKCNSHDYTSKITKKATEKADGVRTYTCKECGKKYNKAIPFILTENSGTFKITAPTVSSATDSAVTLSFSSKNKVTGYEIYRYNGKDWKKVTSTTKTKATLSGLKGGKTYKLRVRAFKKEGGRIVAVSHFSVLEVATKPETTFLTAVALPSDTSATLSWAKAAGANGYDIYTVDSKGTYKKRATVTSGKTTCTINGLKKGESYKFLVKPFRQAKNNIAYAAAGC